ncbi:MAG TPA: isoprenylcysteine carboxylmethyltransferase family protein [Burkholderiales bacterium]
MTQRDIPGVIALPPLLYGGAFLIVLLLHWLWPLPLLTDPAIRWIGAALVVLGMAPVIWGSATMHKAGTNVPPNRPATAMVTSGPFRFSRNPLYTGLHVTFIGLCCIANSLWGLVLFVPLVAVMHYGVILREERYLEAKFGDAYRQYRSTARRYL